MNNDNNNHQLFFTSDKPVIDDLLGTHRHFANLLVQIVNSKSDNPLVVGVFGGWGTGKSSIANMYDQATEESNIKNVYVDVWAFSSAKDRFGAGFLKILASNLINNTLNRLSVERKIDERYETWNTRFDLGRFTLLMLAAILLSFFGVVALSVWIVGWNDEPRLNLLIFLISTVFINGVLNWVLPKIMVTHESRTVDESYNKVEHFKKIFQDILDKSPHQIISIVVDNLDRVEPSDALEIIRMLKTFVSEDVLGDKRLVLIVPCDEQELAKHIKKQLYVEDSHEFLRKFFNITTFVPELVHEDIVSFTKKELDSICGSLTPALSEEDINLVAFVISRAARKNPRQVKVLINSFVGYWQSAGLVGTAGIPRGISALGAVVYVCLLYLRKDQELPKKIDEVFNGSLDKTSEDSDKNLSDFVASIKEFQHYISDLEWLYLRRLQVSADERAVPNFVDIYYAITDLNWAALDAHITDEHNLSDLISRLEIKVRDGDSISRIRFAVWVLSLVADSKIPVNLLPVQLRSYINYHISGQPKEWEDLFGEGLAEYIVQSQFSAKKVSALLSGLKEKAEKEKISVPQSEFISKLIKLSKTDYWANNNLRDSVAGALDGIIFHLIPKTNNQFLNLLLKNLQVIVYDGTGVLLANEIAARYQKNDLKDLDVDNIFSEVAKDNVGVHAFAGRWLQLSSLFYKPFLSEKILLTLQAIDALLSLENPSGIQSRLPSDENFLDLINVMEEFSVRGVPAERKKDLLRITISLSLLVFLSKKLNMTRPSLAAQNAFRDNLFPNLASLLEQLDRDDKMLFIAYLNKYPKILSLVGVNRLALIAYDTDLQILSRIFDDDPEQLQPVLAKLIESHYWSDYVFASLQSYERKSKIKRDEFENIIISSIFGAFEKMSPAETKYQDVSGLLEKMRPNDDLHLVTKKHMLWLINRTDWNDKNSINLTINKMRALEKTTLIDREVADKLREKLDVEILKSVLGDDARSWITKHLGKE